MVRTRVLLALLLVLAAAYAVLLPVLTMRQTDDLARGQLRNLAYARAGALEVGMYRAVEACGLLKDRATGDQAQLPVLPASVPVGTQVIYRGCGPELDPSVTRAATASFRLEAEQSFFVVELPIKASCVLECSFPVPALATKPVHGSEGLFVVLVDEDGKILLHPEPARVGLLADRAFSPVDVQALIDFRVSGKPVIWTSEQLVGQVTVAAIAVVRIPLDGGFLGAVYAMPASQFQVGRPLTLLELGLLVLLVLFLFLTFRLHRVEAGRQSSGGLGTLDPGVLTEEGPGLVLVLQAPGNIHYANREARLVLGLPDNQQHPWPLLSQLVVEEDRGRVQEQLREAPVAGSSPALLFRVLCADGRIRQARALLRRVALMEGAPGVQATLFVEDEVTGGSMDAFTAGFSRARVGLVLLDEHFKIRMANLEMARILGADSPESLTGEAFYRGQGAGRVEPDGGASMGAVDAGQARFFGPLRGVDGQRYAGWAVPLSCRNGLPECVITSFMNVEELASALDLGEQKANRLACGLLGAGVETWFLERETEALTVCRPFVTGQGHGVDCRLVSDWREGWALAPKDLLEALSQIQAGSRQVEAIVPRPGKNGTPGRLLMRGAVLDGGQVAGITLDLEQRLAELDELRQELLVRELIISQAGLAFFVAQLGPVQVRLSQAAAGIFGLESGQDGLTLEDPLPLRATVEPSSWERLERDFREGRQKGSMLESWFSLAPEFGGASFTVHAVFTPMQGAGQPTMVGVIQRKNLL